MGKVEKHWLTLAVKYFRGLKSQGKIANVF